jgi:hypothetical protein
VNVKRIRVEVARVQALDHRVARLLAEERVELLRREMTRSGGRRRRPRERVGLALVGLGHRIAGAPALPRELSSASGAAVRAA